MTEQPNPPRVFISYSHDSEEHRDNVIDLAQELRKKGVDARIDAYVENSPPVSWPVWMYQQIRKADFVLVFCSARYKRRAEGDEDDISSGARWEGGIITQALYDRTEGSSPKYIPLIADLADKTHIPYFLAGTTFYLVGRPRSRDLEALLRRLTRQPGVAPAVLGILPEFVAASKGASQQFRTLTGRPLKDDKHHVTTYLRDSAKILRVLRDDLATADLTGEQFIGVDFSEIYLYMRGDPRFLLARPVVHYCLEKSPWKLILLPGTVQELAHYVGVWTERMTGRAFDKVAQSAELADFLGKFEAQGETAESFEAYCSLFARYAGSIPLQSFALARLRRAVEQLLAPMPEGYSSVEFDMREIDRLKAVLQRFRSPRTEIAAMCDAVNLWCVNYVRTQGDKLSILVSSDRALHRLSEVAYPGASIVRTSREYAFLVHSLGESRSRRELDSRLRDCIGAALTLRRVVGSLSADLVGSPRFRRAFESFAPHYREVLRPVDHMLEAGVSALPVLVSTEMAELYSRLKSEGLAVARFREWCEEVCEELRAMEQLLMEAHGLRQVLRELGHPGG